MTEQMHFWQIQRCHEGIHIADRCRDHDATERMVITMMKMKMKKMVVVVMMMMNNNNTKRKNNKTTRLD